MNKEQALHELRKAHKGMRRLERRLTVAEGLLALIQKYLDQRRYNEVWYIADKAFYSRFRREKAIEKYNKQLTERK